MENLGALAPVLGAIACKYASEDMRGLAPGKCKTLNHGNKKVVSLQHVPLIKTGLDTFYIYKSSLPVDFVDH